MRIRSCSSLAIALLALLASAGAVAQDDDEALTAKLEGYIDCINEHRNRAYQSRARYFSWLKSPERGPTGKEEIVYGIYRLHDTAGCARAIAAAAKMPPEDAGLEADAGEWIVALRALEKKVGEASRYYELEDYKDDGMERGKALHEPLLAAFDAFETADAAFFERVLATTEAKAQRDLERLGADPARRAEFVLATLADRAKRAVEAGQHAGTEDFSRDAYAAALAEYEAAFAAVEGYTAEHPDEEHDGFDVSDEALEFLKAAKTLARREREGMRFDAGERALIDANAAQMVEGHPLHLIDKYNDYVEASNRAR